MMVDYLIVAVLIIYSCLAIIELILLITFAFRFKKTQLVSKEEELPKVSVLICARNEAHNLKDCVDSILTSDYPFELVEILIGDDSSEDDTLKIIKSYEAHYDFVHGFEIVHEKDGLIAKANVLSQLIDVSQSDYQVIIDADMRVTEDWLRVMVSALLAEADMVSGHTQIERSTPITHYQFFDWQVVLHTMKSMADLFRPISILGNNMAFKLSAYEKVGGFRGLGPTDVEDLGLLQLFQKEGFKTRQLIAHTGYAFTKPQLNYTDLLVQRCRWMNGVFKHHWLLTVPAFFARIWLLVSISMIYFSPELSVAIASYGFLFNYWKFIQLSSKVGKFQSFHVITPVTTSLLDTFALFRLIILGKVSWKGRRH